MTNPDPASAWQWRCRDRLIDLRRPVVMGILNVTPDSFSDGGRFAAPGAALEHAEQMLSEGASIIDVGGESTRPGSPPVDAATETERVVPVIEHIAARFDVAISVDTSKPEVMRAALRAGACIVNDVRALRSPGAREVVAASGAGVCLMHMQGEPGTMQQAPTYVDVVAEVAHFLVLEREACRLAGIPMESIVLDPGIGFGKSLAHNLTLLRALARLAALGSPLLLGVSRKSLIGRVLGREVDERLFGGLALAAYGVGAGARIIRTHDVGPTVDAVRMVDAVLQGMA